MLRIAEGFVSCPLARCHGYGVAPSHARQRSSGACCNHPGLLWCCFFFFKLDRTFFFFISFPWKQNSTDQILNDDNPKQRLIHHGGLKKRHFDIIGKVNPGIFITVLRL